MRETAQSTRRSFFGIAGGVALLCTIGGEEIDVSAPDGLARADKAAARVQKPLGASLRQVSIRADLRGQEDRCDPVAESGHGAGSPRGPSS